MTRTYDTVGKILVAFTLDQPKNRFLHAPKDLQMIANVNVKRCACHTKRLLTR